MGELTEDVPQDLQVSLKSVFPADYADLPKFLK